MHRKQKVTDSPTAVYAKGPNVWLAADDDAEVILAPWTARRLPSGDVHLCGYDRTHREGRVSSPLVSFEAKARTAHTSTGRVYKLLNTSGIDRNAEYVWNNWMAINGALGFEDVSEALIANPGRYLPTPRR